MSNSFCPTPEQLKVARSVERAIMRAKKTGLVFYAKSDVLTAYTKEADEYIESVKFEISLMGKGSQIPCIYMRGLIADSGADDYARFLTKEDEERHK